MSGAGGMCAEMVLQRAAGAEPDEILGQRLAEGERRGGRARRWPRGAISTSWSVRNGKVSRSPKSTTSATMPRSASPLPPPPARSPRSAAPPGRCRHWDARRGRPPTPPGRNSVSPAVLESSRSPRLKAAAIGAELAAHALHLLQHDARMMEERTARRRRAHAAALALEQRRPPAAPHAADARAGRGEREVGARRAVGDAGGLRGIEEQARSVRSKRMGVVRDGGPTSLRFVRSLGAPMPHCQRRRRDQISVHDHRGNDRHHPYFPAGRLRQRRSSASACPRSQSGCSGW